ncbi:hypothetical protein RRG08_031257 [Elysia crispata]|uniref:Uncharacterized protein n=1 Tax=Elysia crispata TaxID=231223 RepID=A0AAE1AJZ3_9GAST|nr:hypothetical protein RRG08_031257 [Elysia crispata]
MVGLQTPLSTVANPRATAPSPGMPDLPMIHPESTLPSEMVGLQTPLSTVANPRAIAPSPDPLTLTSK